jgi:hypothetical protein
MEDFRVYQRLNQIQRDKAAMGLGFGGCDNEYLAPDMDLRGMGECGDGILLGGARKKRKAPSGRGPINRKLWGDINREIRKRYPGLQIGAYTKKTWAQYDKEVGRRPVRRSAKRKRVVAKRAPARRAPARRAPARRASSKRGSVRRKAPVKKRSYGYAKKHPTKLQLDNLGLSRQDFNDLKLLERQKARIGYNYEMRDRNARCIRPKRLGEYQLDQDYDCEEVDYMAKKKRRVRRV